MRPELSIFLSVIEVGEDVHVNVLAGGVDLDATCICRERTREWIARVRRLGLCYLVS